VAFEDASHDTELFYHIPNSHMSLIFNKKASFNFEIIEKCEAGIELSGKEVKSVRAGHGTLDGAYVTFRKNAGGAVEAWLINMYVAPYQIENGTDQDPMRERKLLLTQEEIRRYSALERGLTIIPISLYNKKRKIKVEIAVARGKKKFDKRETIKKRDTERAIRREYSDR
jgi:SsrA-binding protein